MKKLDWLSFLAILIATVGLALLKFTGMFAHIVVSVIALLIMVVCVAFGRKDWKIPALEIAYRAFYFVALVTGIVMFAAHLSGAIAIVHKAACAVFAVLLIVNFATKFSKKNS